MHYKHPPQHTEPLAVNPDKAAEVIGLQPPTLEKDRRIGHLGIPFVKAGRRVIYRLADLKDWLKDHRIQPKGKSAVSTDIGYGGDDK